MRMVPALVAAVVAGCVPQTKVWEKAGATQADFNRDRYACLKEAQQRQSVRVGDYSTSDVVTNSTLYTACMSALGWAQTDKAEATPPADEPTVEEAAAAGRALCARPDLAVLFRRIPCEAADATPRQLAERATIDRAEAAALALWRTETAAVTARLAAAYRAQDARHGALLAAAVERAHADADRLALDLRDGRIALGDYNRRRLDIARRGADELRRLARGG